MDSSNSGSFQSSSGAAGGGGGGGGGDNEEYDSRTQSISSFFNPNLNHHFLHPPPPPPSNHQNRPPPTDTTFFNPLEDPCSSWTGTIPPVHTYPINPNLPTTDTNTKPGRRSDHLHPIGITLKNPKKRARASRRAPTTVLTTDTTNFRQMVQEFTGIPTSPFATTRRLDLFRPTAQKLQQPQTFLNPAVNIVESATTSSGYEQFKPSNMHEFKTQPSTFLDLQNNPMLSFQSLLQTSLFPQQPHELQKSWRDQGEKLDSGLENVMISSTSGGDQVLGNQSSWIYPSN